MKPAAAGDNIALIGFMGSGKSSVAREITRLTGRQFSDTDALVVRQAGMPISDIFRLHGEKTFRDWETQALETLVGRERRVIATGGGIVERPENVAVLHRLGCVIWLSASDEVLFSRVSRNTRRPLLQTADPRGTLVALSARRRPLYERCAHHAVDTSGLTHAQVAAAVVAAAEEHFRDD